MLLSMKSGRRAATSATMRLDVRVTDGEATFADDLAARLRDDLACEAVHLPAPDIIRSGQIDAPPIGRQHVFEERQKVLVRTGARIDHIRIGLEALVGANVPEQGVVLLDDGDDVLPRLRRHRADHVPAPVLLKHPPGQFDIKLARAGGIAGDRLNHDRAHASHVLDRGHRTVAAVTTERPIVARRREEDAETQNCHVASTKTPHGTAPLGTAPRGANAQSPHGRNARRSPRTDRQISALQLRQESQGARRLISVLWAQLFAAYCRHDRLCLRVEHPHSDSIWTARKFTKAQ